MKINEQMTLADINDEYAAFVEKFKPKKTTDDCYTPPNVYEAVLDWVVNEYGIDRGNIVRPFWPGADYTREEYPEGCTVVDNPPFSIISEIVKTYETHGVKFFLFAPYLTNLGIGAGIPTCCHIITDASIRYENGAEVNTSFVTNLDDCLVRTVPELRRAILEADAKNRHDQARKLPKYTYPQNVVTIASVGYLSRNWVDYRLSASDATFLRALDHQRRMGKAIFGGGFLISDKAASAKAEAEKTAAERFQKVGYAYSEEDGESEAPIPWELSERERKIIARLGEGGKDG